MVMTPEAEGSDWVEREVHLALREQKPIVPLCLRGDGFAVLSRIQYVDVRNGQLPPPEFYGRKGLKRLVLGSVAVYALALCIQLSVAVVSFYSLVSAAQS